MPHLSIAAMPELRTPTLQTTMRAAVLLQPGSIEIREVPIPVPGPGEVRIRVESCGVCASNLAPWAGAPWFNYPMEPGALGHEACGFVDALGPGVSHLSIGQRAAALSFQAYAEYDIAQASSVIPIPEALHDVPFPGEPLGCALNIFQRAGIRPGDTVAIVGIGFLGAILTQLAVKSGARVIAIGRRPFALKIARQMGASEAMEANERTIEKVRNLTHSQFCDVTIEAAGKQPALDLAAEITKERGRLVIAGYHQDGPRQVNMQLWNWRGLDVINAHEREPRIYIEGIRKAVDAVSEGRMTPAGLITHRFPLEELGAALDMTRDRPEGFLKALVLP